MIGDHMTDTNKLRDLILKAKHAYYYSGEPIMSDMEYDALEAQLKRLHPDDPVLSIVGSPVPANSMLTKAKHSMPMGSQSKVNSEAEFLAWAQKSEGSAIHASLKGDGASAAGYYKDGQLVQVITRGDGEVGEDITANAMNFKGLPTWVGASGVGFTGAVRFEVILTLEDWVKIDPNQSKNPRNAGTGIMGRKNGYQSNYLTVFAFDIDELVLGQSYRFLTEAEKSERIATLGFNAMPYKRCSAAEQAVDYFRHIAEHREALPFWIDGVVLKVDDLVHQQKLGVTSGRPKGQVAWKFDSSGAETVLTSVVISGGHTGSIVPTGQLEPVEIGGTTVSSVSLNNFDDINRLDVAVGDSVWVIKANDIIPKIVRVTHRPSHRQKILEPKFCPFCGGPVARRLNTRGDEGAILECGNANCSKKSSGKINRWISSLDILGIGDVVLEAMIEQLHLEDAADLYTLSKRFEELSNMVTHAERDLRLGQKRAKSILEAIEATKVLTLNKFLGSLGIEYLGKRRVEMMIQSANGELNTLEQWRSGKLRSTHIAYLAGAPNIAASIQDGIDSMAGVIDKMLSNGVVVLSPEQDPKISMHSEENPTRSVCISGKLTSGKKKSDYAEPLNLIGYRLVDEVAKGLTYLVLADPGSSSSKAEKARKLGIEIISEPDLEALIRSN